ncbi:MAG: hypothetical protein REJ50_15595 [Bordetella sp.]|nr:hypothetical protein [Bordetella sp.]
MNIGNMGVGNISSLDLSSMDIETALMMVQSQRVSLLDSQLNQQIQEVQNRNKLTASLNDMQAALNSMKATLPSKDAAPGDKVPDNADNRQLAANFATLSSALGMGTSPVGVNGTVDNEKGVSASQISSMPTREGLEKMINSVKTQLDTASNSQQMDMLRLQSMSNKRNEAFDVMTNFVKKMQDSRSSIIGNMR